MLLESCLGACVRRMESVKWVLIPDIFDSGQEA